MAPRFDVIVLGAGVVGLSTARRLGKSGAKVLVLDPHAQGGRGSRAAAGVAIPSLRLASDPAMAAFASVGKDTLTSDLSQLGNTALRKGSGIARIATDELGRDALESLAVGQPGWLGKWVDRDELFSLEPVLRGGTVRGAFLLEDAHMVDTDVYLTSLLHECAGAGVELRLGVAATSVEETTTQVKIGTATETFEGERLVVAAGAWSGRMPGLTPLPVGPMRGQMLTVFSPEHRLSRIVTGAAYLAPWRAGHIVVGATEEDAGFKEFTTPAGLLHLSATVARLAPVLRDAQVTSHWAGLRSFLPGGKPLIGPYPGTSRVFVGTGHGGQGILTGALTGQALFDLLEGRPNEVTEPFRRWSPRSEETK